MEQVPLTDASVEASLVLSMRSSLYGTDYPDWPGETSTVVVTATILSGITTTTVVVTPLPTSTSTALPPPPPTTSSVAPPPPLTPLGSVCFALESAAYVDGDDSFNYVVVPRSKFIRMLLYNII